jgi:predicted AlkP superfamily phosphohydrolase/phosphomutase
MGDRPVDPDRREPGPSSLEARPRRGGTLDRGRTLAIGLDGFEISLAERLMVQGDLPVLAARRRVDAHALLDAGADQRTGLAWEHFWSGRSPRAAHRGSAVEFDRTTYTVWQEGARFGPFFHGVARTPVVFDAPYVDLRRAPGVRGIAAWGAHDPGLDRTQSEPRSLRRELQRRIGAYPGEAWLYATPWASPVDARRMGDDLVAAVDARSRAAQWLLAERVDDWDLGVVVVSEPHSAAEGLWHGVDPTHPLHALPSARAAGEGLVDVYRATDRLVGDLVAATDPTTVVVFSMGGMGPNHSDAASMVGLPELLLRWSLGEARLDVPTEWASVPDQVPIGDEARVRWSRDWFRDVAPAAPPPSRSRAARVGALLPAAVREPLQRVRAERRRAHLPPGHHDLDWQPATWYADRWPAMRAFALPSFYDGRIRVNVRGREGAGVVDAVDYARVCDELEALVRECVDPRTGAGVVASVERPGGDDPMTVGSSFADLVVEWTGGPLALRHPVHGTIGPVPYRRTGGHTGPFGFVSITAPGVAPADLGVASAHDVAPTIAELLAAGSDHPPRLGVPEHSDLSVGVRRSVR